MLNFTYSSPTLVLFGRSQIAAISAQLPPTARVLITYGGGSVLKNGVLAKVREALQGRTCYEFSGIEPNPDVDTLLRALTLIKEHSIDFLLAVGGGSVLDGTKFLAAAARHQGDAWQDLMLRQQPLHDALPVGCVLTLPATGSETNAVMVISRRASQDKMRYSSPLLRPRFAVLDPETTFTLPPKQIGLGSVDAFMHVMEQYMTFPSSAAVQDVFAEGLLRVIMQEGPKALAHPEDYEVRANLMWASTLALNSIIGVGVPQDWSSHVIGYELTAIFDLAHAETLAVIFPALLSVRRQEKQAKIVQYAERVLGIQGGDPTERVEKAIQETGAFFSRMGIKTRLRDYGIERSAIDLLIQRLREHGRVALGERGDITPEVARKILEAAY
jgi:NADP-dependent alcohol dehydrogenase